MNQYKVEAQNLLGYLREGTSQSAAFLDQVREKSRKGGFSFADIGTSEEELEQLQVKGHMVSAQELLGYLRGGTSQFAVFLAQIREEARKGGFWFVEIGTDWKELEQLRVKSHMVSAQELLGYLRGGTSQFAVFLAQIREEVRKGWFLLVEIGTSEEELVLLNRVPAAYR